MALEPVGFRKSLSSNWGAVVAITFVAGICGVLMTGTLYAIGINHQWSSAAIGACFPIFGLFYGMAGGFLAALIVFALESLNNREFQGKIISILSPNQPIDPMN